MSAYANAGSAYSSGITGMIVAPSQSEFTEGHGGPRIATFDIWPLKLSGAPLPADRLRPLLVETWQPWLDGAARATRR